jgi:hypothetical protein
MKNRHLVRYGTTSPQMRPMAKDDILISRLGLLIIMAKAYLKSYPMGEFRKKAITDNARFVFYEALIRTHSNTTPSLIKTQPQTCRHDTRQIDNLFLLRAQLLAVMVNSFAEKKSKGNFRKKAMAENIDILSEYLADGFQLGDTKILKVA